MARGTTRSIAFYQTLPLGWVWRARLVLDAIIVIAQYARDQAMGSARDQAAKVSLRRADHYHGEHTPGSLRRTVSSCRIAILHLPDNYNRRIGLQTSVGGARMHCMHA